MYLYKINLLKINRYNYNFSLLNYYPIILYFKKHNINFSLQFNFNKKKRIVLLKAPFKHKKSKHLLFNNFKILKFFFKKKNIFYINNLKQIYKILNKYNYYFYYYYSLLCLYIKINVTFKYNNFFLINV